MAFLTVLQMSVWLMLLVFCFSLRFFLAHQENIKLLYRKYKTFYAKKLIKSRFNRKSATIFFSIINIAFLVLKLGTQKPTTGPDHFEGRGDREITTLGLSNSYSHCAGTCYPPCLSCFNKTPNQQHY